MADILKLPEPQDQWQFTVEVWRRPDGAHAARLVDCRTSLVESGDTESHAKMHEIANLLEQSVGPMRAEAEMLKPSR